MTETKRTRQTFTKEEKKAKLREKIEFYKMKIAECEAKIAELDKPAVTMKDIYAKIKAANLSNEEVMRMLDKMEAKKNS